MKVKAMVVAGCMGLSLNAFAQGYGYGPQGRDPAASEPATSTETQGSAQQEQDRIESERLASRENRCSGLSGNRLARCMDSGTSATTGSSIQPTQQQGQSGPGTTDKTHQGHPEYDVGTSSAGG